MLSRSDEVRFYEAEKRILRQFEDDKDVQDYLEYLENQDEELFIRVSDLKIEIQELEEELSELAEECNEWVSEARELKILNNQLKKESNEVTKELERVEEELRMMTEDYTIELRLNTHLLNENSVLKADLERLRQED